MTTTLAPQTDLAARLRPPVDEPLDPAMARTNTEFYLNIGSVLRSFIVAPDDDAAARARAFDLTLVCGKTIEAVAVTDLSADGTIALFRGRCNARRTIAVAVDQIIAIDTSTYGSEHLCE